jgi:hypothetical protein
VTRKYNLSNQKEETMSTIKAVKQTLEEKKEFVERERFDRIHIDPETKETIVTNGHMLLVAPEESLKPEPADEKTLAILRHVIPACEGKPTVRLDLRYLKRIVEFFDNGWNFDENGDPMPVPVIDIYITASDKQVVFKSASSPGHTAVVMPIRQ